MHHDALLGENGKMRNSLKHYLANASMASSNHPSSNPHTMLAKQVRGHQIPMVPHQ
jgi:hypothetical protein